MSQNNEIAAICSHCGDKLPPGLSDGFCPKCALADTDRHPGSPAPDGEPAEPREKAPERIGKYRILKEIGEGGFGIVYMAEQKEPVRRRVALKVLKRGMDTRQVVTRFELERQALAMMDHPNVAMVFDGGEAEDGRPFFAMEFVEGIPITKFCDNHRMSIPQRLELLIQVCRGLQHCHQKGLIHRDVKPPNVLVAMRDGHPVPKIIDFGIAKVTTFMTKNTLFTDPGKRVGTPVYMSPEQLRMDAFDVDVRTDIYSIGALLYELVSGATPFDHRKLMAAGYAEMERIIREQDPPKPSARLTLEKESAEKAAQNRSTTPPRLRAALRRDLDWIVLRAMAKSRERRYQSASELADDLIHYMKGEPVKAGPPTASYRLSKFVGRHRARLASAAAIVLVIVGMAVYHLVSKNQAEAAMAVRMLTRPDAKTGLLQFYLGELRPHLDDVADDLKEIALSQHKGSRAGLHAAIAVLPRKPEVLPHLVSGLLALEPMDPEDGEDLEDFLKILHKYVDDKVLDANQVKNLVEMSWRAVDAAVVPLDEEVRTAEPVAASTPLSAVVLLAQFDAKNPRWKKEELVKHALTWVDTTQTLELTQLRKMLLPALQPVSFGDGTLRNKLIIDLGKRDQLPMDFDLLTKHYFKAEGRKGPPIRDLSGMEGAVNMTRLDFDYNKIADLSPLKALTKLEELDFQNNLLSEIKPLADMKLLKNLDIRQNEITDLSPLAGLTALEELQLSENKYLGVKDSLEPLKKLVNLTTLEIIGCQVPDISFVKNLTRLTRLDLHKNLITDLTPIADIQTLEYLDISENEGVKDLRPLENLKNFRFMTIVLPSTVPIDELTRFTRVRNGFEPKERREEPVNGPR